LLFLKTPSPSEESLARDSQKRVGALLNLIADSIHNLTDGMAIAASFLAGYQVGVSTTIAVFVHEIPHEIGDYALLLQAGWTKKNAMMAQLVTAIGAFIGVGIGLLTGGEAEGALWVLPFTAGGFIYIATVDVLPDLFQETSLKQTIMEVAAMTLGVMLMVLIAKVE